MGLAAFLCLLCLVHSSLALLQPSVQENVIGLLCCDDVADIQRTLAELEDKIASQESKIAALQTANFSLTAKNAEQDDRLTNVEQINNAQDAAIAALQASSNAPAPATFPMNGIYVQYTNADFPGDIWSQYTWSDISSSFEGSFFRAITRDQPFLEAKQEESCPKITKLSFTSVNSPANFPYEFDPNVQVQPAPSTGSNTGATSNVFLNLAVEGYGTEVRPKNVPVVIWRRVG